MGRVREQDTRFSENGIKSLMLTLEWDTVELESYVVLLCCGPSLERLVEDEAYFVPPGDVDMSSVPMAFGIPLLSD